MGLPGICCSFSTAQLWKFFPRRNERYLSAKSLKSRHATLLELLVALAIIASLSSLFLVNAAKLFRQQRFRSGCERSIARLNLAEEMMVSLSADVKCIFLLKEDGVFTYFEIDGPLSFRLAKELATPMLLEGIGFFLFQEEGGAAGSMHEPQRERAEIRFYSKSSFVTRGKLFLYASKEGKGGESRVIDLPGYATTFPLQKEEESWFNGMRGLSRDLYPKLP